MNNKNLISRDDLLRNTAAADQNPEENQEEKNNVFLLTLLITIPVLFLLFAYPGVASAVVLKTKKMVQNQTKTIEIDPAQIKTVLRKRARCCNPILDKQEFKKKVAAILFEHWVKNAPTVEKIFVPTFNTLKNESGPRFLTNTEILNSMRNVSLRRNAAKIAQRGERGSLTLNLIKVLIGTNILSIAALVSTRSNLRNSLRNKKSRREFAFISVILFMVLTKTNSIRDFFVAVNDNQQKGTAFQRLKAKLLLFLIKNKYSLLSILICSILIFIYRKKLMELILFLKNKIQNLFQTVKTELPKMVEIEREVPKIVEVEKEIDPEIEITETDPDEFIYRDEFNKVSVLKHKLEQVQENLEHQIYRIKSFGTKSKEEKIRLMHLIKTLLVTKDQILNVDVLLENIPKQFHSME